MRSDFTAPHFLVAEHLILQPHSSGRETPDFTAATLLVVAHLILGLKRFW
jgi:hypothetical protein